MTPCSFPCPCRIIAYSFTVSFHFAAPLAFIMQEFSETTAPTVAPPTRSGDSDAQACRQRNERKVSEFSLEPWWDAWTVLAGGGGKGGPTGGARNLLVTLGAPKLDRVGAPTASPPLLRDGDILREEVMDAVPIGRGWRGRERGYVTGCV